MTAREFLCEKFYQSMAGTNIVKLDDAFFALDIQKKEKQNDWQEVRVNAAIAAMQGFVTALTNNPTVLVNWNRSSAKEGKSISQMVSEFAVVYADNLIEELRKEEK